jgi:formylmethanofuran dehydrogenase subunit E
MLSPTSLRILVENTTSALDAVQRLTGCTFGNGRLQALDYGRHIYTFIYQDNQALRFTLRPENIDVDPEFLTLETKIQNQRATMQETARYQILLDKHVAYWLKTPFETLFETHHTNALWLERPITSVLVICDRCNQAVLQTHLVEIDGEQICRACRSTDV